MADRCATCAHPDRAAIDAALAEGAVSVRALAAGAGVSERALRRHRDHTAAPLRARGQGPSPHAPSSTSPGGTIPPGGPTGRTAPLPSPTDAHRRWLDAGAELRHHRAAELAELTRADDDAARRPVGDDVMARIAAARW